MSRVLMPLTAAASLTLTDGGSHPTGFWAEEFVVAHRELTAAGHEVLLATPHGKPAPVDPGSVDAAAVGPQAAKEFADYLAQVKQLLEHPAVLEDQMASDFDAIVLPGGHGPMVDLASDDALGSILAEGDASGTIIAPFCHGPAALLSANRPDGSFVFAGRKLTAFTDAEEQTGGVVGVPWLLESRLVERGALVESGEPWADHLVIDGNLISGQNPQSSSSVTNAVLEALA